MEQEKKQFLSRYLWVVGSILLVIFGYAVWKMVSSPYDEYKLSLVNAPTEVKAGDITTFTWKIDGPSSVIYHTALYFGNESVSGKINKEIAPVETKYNKESLVDFNFGKYKIPLLFIGNMKFASPGKYYYRLHALIKDKNYWSEEYTIEVK